MDYELAKFVASIISDPHDASLIDEVKGLTFSQYAEYALLQVGGGEQVLVKGGRMGILFELDAEGHMIVATPLGRRRVISLLWHTHPVPTGPSDHDRGVLRLLGQAESVIYELNGEVGGTRIHWRQP